MFMMRDRKGMTMALGVIIAIVVLIVVALAVIAVTSGSVNIFGRDTGEATEKSGSKIVGTASCTDCGWRETKGAASPSELDDILHRNPYYCENAGGVQYCCDDVAKTHCITKSTDCGTPAATRAAIEDT
ncbi:MAG: hypothetical protein V1718_01025, partial [archaeon]